MQDAKNFKEYKGQVREALGNDFLRTAMDNFAIAYRTSRANAFKEIDDKALIKDIAKAKACSTANIDELFVKFKEEAEKNGAVVHLAATAKEANEIIGRIAQEEKCTKIVKSKSMTAEETLLNHHLEDLNLDVVETDLGEWIIQLRHEGPSHMVMPAIHLSRHQVSETFTEATGKKQDDDIQKLVKVARRELRQKFTEADMGISGCNFAIAETGTIGIVTNEGNARLVTTLPRVHVALMGLDKLTPNLHDALRVLRALPRNATGQAITSYVTWITGSNECAVAEDDRKKVHFVFLDNGRRALAKDPVFAEVLQCVRCGACANVCPVYRMVGGHKMGHIYIGAIGLILTYFFHGTDKAKNLVQNCINCGACKEICAGGIDLPALIKEIHARIQDEEGHPLTSALLGKMMKNRKLFHKFLRIAKYAQKPVAGNDGFLRHLPMIFAPDHDFRSLPVVAEVPFRDMWSKVKPAKIANPKHKVAIFSGCVQDFVYPEQSVATVESMRGKDIALEFPMDQSCCGLPLQMMGEKQACRDVAIQNMEAFENSDCEYILTMCASCASHLKHNYPKMLGHDPKYAIRVQEFADKVIDYSSFMNDVVGIKEEDFLDSKGKKVTYHAPCHLCRGLDVKAAPRELMVKAGLDYVECAEEEVCCGFGGTYSVKFPKISEQLLSKKMHNVEETGAAVLLTDCPGCVMQLRGGAKKKGLDIEVRHVAELLSERRK
ncbi:L-lactate dehydrogenase (quinone) large subunit LdhH [Maridesulfovibrio ferrireducens]|uniref:L-lactate dehydrogenase (quinone) large subunit LdhH n=1 Tax=Maridesulfovibrio ferrireducens TaxID=246191 RepID=UPI001A2E2968|nr:LUD domain-containing protein [Maridesulfovibrio ferrireducens]MBI9110598.1 LUD domain-containing protein [Maridesulfovibrio ferrireducens]